MHLKYRIAATAAFGLESVVKKECEELGFSSIHVDEGRIFFDGEAADVAKANLCLRSADRVLLEVGRFSAESFEELFDRTAALPWPSLLPEDAAFPVRGKSYRSTLASVPDVQRIVKKAIAAALQRKWDVDWLPETGAAYPVEVALRRNECVIFLDTTGEGLFKRGYRQKKGGAPLKETLASGLISLSVWHPSRPLVDPFCGSGTLLIEAALQARGMAPGLERSFLSMDWPIVGEEVYRQARRACLRGIRLEEKLLLTGFDKDPRMIEIARKNAEAAGVGEDIRFICKDMRAVDLQENFGVIITNPPYGKRLGEEEETRALMRAFGERFGRLRTWSFYVLTGLADFEDAFGRAADRRRKLFNGGIETTYYQYLGPNPQRFQ
ncbi:MAG: class I SAM-dependent RNA methyltransferase [Ndongobacter sp.]|nr:class I SAM-dependent RNA methyltransferase [Ndongobacter sp.]